MMPHLEEGTLHELLDGEIPSTALPPIQAHLAGCAACRARLEEARGLQSASDGLIEQLDDAGPAPTIRASRPALPNRASWPRRLAWAATIVVAAGLGYAARGGLPPAGRAESGSADTARPADQLAVQDAPTRAAAPAAMAPTGSSAVGGMSGSTGKTAGVRGQPARQDAVDQPQRNEAIELVERKASNERDATTAPAPPAAAPASLARERVTQPAVPTLALGERSLGDEAARTGTLASAKLSSAVQAPDTISFIEAVRLLGGQLRLIEGLVPARLEAVGAEVRVVYAGTAGELLLTERLVGGRVIVRLVAPAGFPADSLARLQAKVRE